MLSKKVIGILGILIPITFCIGFGIFHTIINPEYIENSPLTSLAAYNIDYTNDGINYWVKGDYWVKGIIYLGLGQLISIFSIGLFIHSKGSNTNRIASILLLISGIIWLSFGI